MFRTGHDLAITELEGGVRLHEQKSWIQGGALGFGVGAAYRRPALVDAQGRQVPIRDYTAVVRMAVVGMVLLAALLRRFR